MERIKYDSSLLQTMSIFEKITGTAPKDCFNDKNTNLVFVVEEESMSRAIGKGGANVKKMEGLLNRKIKILGYTPDVVQFVRNILYPLQAEDITEQEGTITITGHDSRTKGLIIGRDSQNLKSDLAIIQRYFDRIKELKVV